MHGIACPKKCLDVLFPLLNAVNMINCARIKFNCTASHSKTYIGRQTSAHKFADLEPLCFVAKCKFLEWFLFLEIGSFRNCYYACSKCINTRKKMSFKLTVSSEKNAQNRRNVTKMLWNTMLWAGNINSAILYMLILKTYPRNQYACAVWKCSCAEFWTGTVARQELRATVRPCSRWITTNAWLLYKITVVVGMMRLWMFSARIKFAQE